jgi:hypothetical protein
MHDESTSKDYQIAHSLVGKSYEFDDGDRLEVIQAKRREDGPWITYHTIQSGGIPRKLLLPVKSFLEHYGHLFNINT